MRLINSELLLESTDSDVTKPFEKTISRYDVISCPTVSNVIAFPDNATNGDMIKTLFPKLNFTNVLAKMYTQNGQLLLDWWNTPYNPQQNLSYTDKSGANIASQDILRSAT